MLRNVVQCINNSEYFQSLFSAVHGDAAPLVRIAWRNSTPKVLSTVSKMGRSVGVSGGQDDDGQSFVRHM